MRKCDSHVVDPIGRSCGDAYRGSVGVGGVDMWYMRNLVPDCNEAATVSRNSAYSRVAHASKMVIAENCFRPKRKFIVSKSQSLAGMVIINSDETQKAGSLSR